MSLHAGRGRPSLRSALDRDVYQILGKLEEKKILEEDGKPFKSVTELYYAIKRSNSSLSRQKKKSLEESCERALFYREWELSSNPNDEESDFEEPEPSQPEDKRFLLNRQMTRHWHQNTDPIPAASETRSAKKRRIDHNSIDPDGRASGNEAPFAGSQRPSDTATTDSHQKDMTAKVTQKKPQKSVRHKVEHLFEPIPLAGVDELWRELLHETRPFLRWPGLYTTNRWYNLSGILISGPTGVGKKSLVRSLAAELQVPLISLAHCLEDPERLDKSLSDAVDEAMRLAPSIIFFEQLDWYMAKPGSSGHSEHHRRVITQFMRHMRRIDQDQPKDRPVLAMATTSNEADIDPAILKVGLFEEVVPMRVPDMAARQDIFKLLVKHVAVSDNVRFCELAKMTHGFVGADIFNIVKQAQKAAAKRALCEAIKSLVPNGHSITPQFHASGASNTLKGGELGALGSPREVALEFEDFAASIRNFTPTLRKAGFTVIPSVTWDQVGALHHVREQLYLTIVGPIKTPDVFRAFGLQRPAGVLLWGPPGCGKTLVAQAVANEAQASFILINGPELLNKYVGESERAIRELFQRARSSTPCILFFDEMDSLVSKRNNASTEAGARVVNALLTELDGAQDRSGIYVIGTTNRPDMIDAAMLRPGRLSERLFIDLPTDDERVEILQAIYRKCHPGASDEQMERLATVARDARCTDFSGADLDGLHTKAAQNATNRWIRKVKTDTKIDDEDWEHALAHVHRSVHNPESYRALDKKLRYDS